jgi:MFS family permease
MGDRPRLSGDAPVAASRDKEIGRSAGTSLLRDRAIRRLAIGYGFSAIGSAMAGIAVAFVAYRETGSIVLTALVFSGNTLPFLALAPLSGRLVSQFDIRYLLIAIDVGKVFVWAAAAVLAGLGELGYGLILVVNFTSGSLSALSAAAWPRVSELAAPPGRLPELSALFSSITASAGIAGALLGGTVVFALGETWVFAIDAFTYLPQIAALALLPTIAALPHRADGAVRSGIRFVRETDQLREAFVLAALLNFAAFPLLSMLPAMASDIDARGHVLGFLTCAFYAGGALVVWAVRMLRRRFAYSRILFVGFLGTGLLLVAHATLTGWRSPGLDAVTASMITLLPLGLAVSLNASLLQALVVLACPDEEKAGVLAVYGTIAAVLMPLGGIVLGVAADLVSPWAAAFASGSMMTALALALRRRLGVFDALGSQAGDRQMGHSMGGHWHTHHRYIAGADFALLTHAHLGRLAEASNNRDAAREIG